ncbi:MAG: DUF1566 domain-containing protein [Nitrospirae bacterium]|nr:DUF1566 domain-containing protein [Nitrospirota bacterium]
MKIFRTVVVLILSLSILLTFGCNMTSGLDGKVVDGKNQPIAGVKVIAKQNQPQLIKGYEQFESTTGSDGKFTFKNLYSSSDYTLSLWHKDWKTDTTMAVQAARKGKTLLKEPLKVLFKVDNDGIITATGTGLQWYYGPDKNTNWNEANSWVKSLSIGGGGWRLPTRAELKGLYDGGMRLNAWVWSGELNGPSDAWDFNFVGGGEDCHIYGSGDERAFAVRSR